MRMRGLDPKNTYIGAPENQTQTRPMTDKEFGDWLSDPQRSWNNGPSKEASISKKGGENAAAARGREAHKEFAEKVKNKPGWQSEPSLTDPKTGKTVKPDAVTPSGKPVELKPKTDSGKAQGARQLPKYERATGKNGKVIYYEPKK